VRYRYYHPGLGRWLARDPLYEPGFALREQSLLILRHELPCNGQIARFATIAMVVQASFGAMLSQVAGSSWVFLQLNLQNRLYRDRARSGQFPRPEPIYLLPYGFVGNRPLLLRDVLGLAPSLSVDYNSCNPFAAVGYIYDLYITLLPRIQARIDANNVPVDIVLAVESTMSNNSTVIACCEAACCAATKPKGRKNFVGGCTLGAGSISICKGVLSTTPPMPKYTADTVAFVEVAKDLGYLKPNMTDQGKEEYTLAGWLQGI
jgi:hypothetical protein